MTAASVLWPRREDSELLFRFLSVGSRRCELRRMKSSPRDWSSGLSFHQPSAPSAAARGLSGGRESTLLASRSAELSAESCVCIKSTS